MYKKGVISWNKGKHIQTNTGRTHFKKGLIPWNKGKKMFYTEKRRAYDKRQKGITKKKPINFSDTMRKINPPLGRKIDSKGYILIYKPNYEGSYKGKTNKGYIFEHKFIMELKIGRILKSSERIHHINNIKSDNKIENLLLCENPKEHTLIHWKMQELIFDLIKKGLVFYDGQKFNIR